MNLGSVEFSIKAIDQASAVINKISQSLGQLPQRANKVSQAANTASAATNNLARSFAMGSLGAIGLGTSVATTILTIAKFTKSVIDAEVKMTQLMLRFKVAAGGDTVKAGKMFQFAEEMSARLGLSLETTADSFSRFMAAAKGTALQGAEAEKVFTAVSEAAAAMGLESYQVERAFKALEQMVSKGSVQMEELRGQLAEQIPGAFQMAAKAMGMTTRELSKAMEKGEVMATDLIPKLAAAWHELFGPVAEENASRLTGAIGALESAWFKFKTAILDSDKAVGAIHAITEALSSLAAQQERVNAAKERYIALLEQANNVKFNREQRVEISKGAGVDPFTRRVVSAFGEKSELDALANARAQVQVTKALEEQSIATFNASTNLTILSLVLNKSREDAEKWVKTYDKVYNLTPAGDLQIRAVQPDRYSGEHPLDKIGEDLTYNIPDLSDSALKRQQAAMEAFGDASLALREKIEDLAREGMDPLAKISAESADKLEDLNQKFAELKEKAAKAKVEVSAEDVAAYNAAVENVNTTLQKNLMLHTLGVEIAREGLMGSVASTNALKVAHAYNQMQLEVQAINLEFKDGAEKEQKLLEVALKFLGVTKEINDSVDNLPIERLQMIVGAGGSNAAAAATELFRIQMKRVQLMTDEKEKANEILRLTLELKSTLEGIANNSQSKINEMWDSWIDAANVVVNAVGQLNESLGKVLSTMNGIVASWRQMQVAKQAYANATTQEEKNAATAAQGAATANIYIALVMAVIDLTKAINASRERKRYGSAAVVTVGGTATATNFGAGTGNAMEMSNAIVDLLRSLESVTGTFIQSMGQLSVKIRNDGKKFVVTLAGVYVGTFDTAEKAVAAAARAAFSSAELSGTLTQAMREMLERFAAQSAEELMRAADYITRIEREISGKSDMDLAIANFTNSIAQVKRQLIEFGVSVGEALRLSLAWGLSQAQGLWRSISGQQMTPKEELAMKKAQAKLLILQLKLWKAELMARAKYLEGLGRLTGFEFGGGGGGGKGFRQTELTAKVNFMKADVQITGDYIQAKAKGVNALADVYQYELDLIYETIKGIDELIATIDLDKIKIGGGGGKNFGKNLGKSMDSLKDALLDLAKLQRDMLTGPNSPFTTEQQTKVLGGELFGLFGKSKLKAEDVRRIMELIPDYLDAFGSTFGTGGAGYMQEFSRIQELITALLQSNGVTPLVDWQQQLEELYGISATAPTGAASSPFTVTSKVLETKAKETAENTDKTRVAVKDGTTAIVAALVRIENRLSPTVTGPQNLTTDGTKYLNSYPGKVA